jgi:hypothetical protein
VNSEQLCILKETSLVYKIKVGDSRKGSKNREQLYITPIHFYEIKLLNKQRPLCCSIIHKSWDMLAFQFTMNTIQSRHILCLLRYTGCSQERQQQAFRLLLKCSTLNLGGTSELPSLL